MRTNQRSVIETRRPRPAVRGIGSEEHERVYAQIHEAIAGRRLPPGSKLKEVPLAELFGVTRGVIRKALVRLATLGLVELRHNRGAVVASPGLEESRQIFAARRAIECELVELLAESCPPSALRTLKALIQKENKAYERLETEQALNLSVAFHRELARLAGNTVMADILERLVAQTPLVLLAWQDPGQSGNCTNLDHAMIVEAIEAKDAARARVLMKCHLCNLEGQLRQSKADPADELARIFGQAPSRARQSGAH